MQTTQYNGWTNYETCAVNLWLDNDQGSQEYWEEQAQECFNDTDEDDTKEDRINQATHQLAAMLESEHEEGMPEVTGVFADLLNSAMSEVNWYEIAQSIVLNLDLE